MKTPIYQVDAFTQRRFAGNPAAVMPMATFPSETTMQAIASENNLAETAFVVPEGNDYRLRWFTPITEVPLCGHATLATAAVVMERIEPGRKRVTFHTESGPLTVTHSDDGYRMDFPARISQRIETPSSLSAALGIIPSEVWRNEFNYLAIVEDENTLRGLSPDMPSIARLDRPGVIVSAEGRGIYDFVSRYFAPAKGIPEDPVTGSAHCMLVPYWAKRLGKNTFRAYQASTRGGEVVCTLKGDRVELQGDCVFYLEGEVEL